MDQLQLLYTCHSMKELLVDHRGLNGLAAASL